MEWPGRMFGRDVSPAGGGRRSAEPISEKISPLASFSLLLQKETKNRHRGCAPMYPLWGAVKNSVWSHISRCGPGRRYACIIVPHRRGGSQTRPFPVRPPSPTDRPRGAAPTGLNGGTVKNSTLSVTALRRCHLPLKGTAFLYPSPVGVTCGRPWACKARPYDIVRRYTAPVEAAVSITPPAGENIPYRCIFSRRR